MDGFEDVDYEGHAMLKCTRPKCDFNTFNPEAAEAHGAEHQALDEAALEREALTETQTPDYGPEPEAPKPKRQTKAKVKDD